MVIDFQIWFCHSHAAPHGNASGEKEKRARAFGVIRCCSHAPSRTRSSAGVIEAPVVTVAKFCARFGARGTQMSVKKMLNRWSLQVAAVAVAASAASPTILAAELAVPAQFRTIQAAINASANGDSIIVSPGTYNELIRFYGKAITLRSLSGAGKTIIDGGSLGTTVKFANAETATTVLDGFTIQHGRAAVGAGMYINSSSPTVRNCVLVANNALDRGAGAAVVNGKPSFTNCTFDTNTATERGGAAYLMVNSDVVWTSCIFNGNLAMNRNGESYGGAIAAESESDQTFTGCEFTSNKAEPDSGYTGGARGGAVWLNGPVGVFANCTFTTNAANPRTGDGYGGAVYTYTAAPSITGCVFTGNKLQHLAPTQ